MLKIGAELALALGASLSKFLLKNYLGEFKSAVAGGFIDFGKDRAKAIINDPRLTRKAELEFEKIGTDILERIEVDLQTAVLRADEPRPDANKILRRFEAILSGPLAATFVIRSHIVPDRLADAIRDADTPSSDVFTEEEQSLFNDTCTSISQYLFRAASKLPQFDEARKEETIATLTQLASELSDVLDDTQRIREHVVTAPLTDELSFENSYRNVVVAELDKVELFGIDLPPELKEAKLTDAYITLRLRQGSYVEDDSMEPSDDETLEGSDTPSLLTAEAAFDRLSCSSGRLLVRGGAGCGKTTLIRWAAIEAARGTSPQGRTSAETAETADGRIRLLSPEEKERLRLDWRRRMPFVITLRNCPNGVLPQPEELPAQIAREIGNPAPRWVQRLLQQGQCLLLIDGVDEVAKLNHRALYDSINRLCTGFPDNYFVITTRPDAVTDVRFEDLGFVPTEVEPLEDDDRELFIRHWFRAIGTKLKVSAKRTQDLEDEAWTLIKLIGHTPWLAQLATTPLYCAMTCALYRDRGGALPPGLNAMCETLCEMMVDRRDRDRKLPIESFPLPYSQLTYTQKRLLLRELAYYFIAAGQSAVPVPDAIDQIGRTLEGMLHRGNQEAASIFESLLNRSGMLRIAAPAIDDHPETVQFVHNTFKEFLAGLQVANDSNAHFLAKQIHDETWRRVALFAIGAGASRFQNDFLRLLLKKISDPLPRERIRKSMTDYEIANSQRGLAIFAFRCGLLGDGWKSEIKGRLSGLTTELFPPRRFSEAEWLASAGNIAVPLLTVSPRAHVDIVSSCVRALRLIGTPDAHEALGKYVNDSRVKVLAELAKVYPIGALQHNFVLGQIFAIPSQVAPYVHTIESLVIPEEVTSFDISGTKVSDISNLSKCSQFQELRLADTEVASLEPLRYLDGLSDLRVATTPVSSIEAIRDLHKLAFLDISWTGVADLGPLVHLICLHTLCASGTPIADISPIERLTRLKTLQLESVSVMNWSALQQLTQLEELDLSNSNINDLSVLQSLRNLHTLELRGTRITDLSALQELTAIKSLHLAGTGITDITPLTSLSELESLELAHCQITDISPLQELSKLRRLGLYSTPVADIDGLRKLERMESLDLELTDVRNADALKTMPFLRYVDLYDTRIPEISELQERNGLTIRYRLRTPQRRDRDRP